MTGTTGSLVARRLWTISLPVVIAALFVVVTAAAVASASAQEGSQKTGGEAASAISLPAPRAQGGMPLLDALKNRQSARAFSSRDLPPQVLSDLLWAAAGINRPDSGKRTAPSARNWQEVEVYAVLQGGAYLYDAAANALRPVARGDLRALTGMQDFVASAPLNLVYVADLTKLKDASPEDRPLYMGADTGFMAENVYLLCASEGLAVVVRANVDREKLAPALRLGEQKRIVLAQTIGYPGEAPAVPMSPSKSGSSH